MSHARPGSLHLFSCAASRQVGTFDGFVSGALVAVAARLERVLGARWLALSMTCAVWVHRLLVVCISVHLRVCEHSGGARSLKPDVPRAGSANTRRRIPDPNHRNGVGASDRDIVTSSRTDCDARPYALIRQRSGFQGPHPTHPVVPIRSHEGTWVRC